MARIDIHREGALIPGNYRYVLSYQLATIADGWPIPAFGVNCGIDHRDPESLKNGEHAPDGRCCVVGLIHKAKVKFAQHGGTGQCTACGSHFVYGDVWEHIPSGEHIHVGHICARKMELFADRSEWEQASGQHKARSISALQREEKKRRAAEFLADNPGLEEALQGEHHILADLSSKLRCYGSLSERQVELAYKIAREISEQEQRREISQHVGEVGKRVEITVSVQRVTSWDNGFGKMFLYIMLDDAGNKIVWRTSSLPDFYKGDRILIRGTVREHGEYQGEKQTSLTRVILREMVEKGPAHLDVASAA